MTARPWTHDYTCAVTGSAARVFAALTDAHELRRWFAEYVEIDPRVGGTFVFFGKHTYGAPDKRTGRQVITRFEHDRQVGFSWPLEGVKGEVTIELDRDTKAADGDRTRVHVRHAFDDALPTAYGAELVDDLWRLTLGNIESHLRGGAGIVLPDFTDPSVEVRLSIHIDAPRGRVFKALIEPAALNRWIASAADVEPRLGGRYSYSWKYDHAGRQVESGPTKILDFVPDERLVTDWTDWRGDDTRPATRVAWLLADEGTGTKLTLIHDGFSRVVDQSDYPFGWVEFMNQLKAEAERVEVAI